MVTPLTCKGSTKRRTEEHSQDRQGLEDDSLWEMVKGEGEKSPDVETQLKTRAKRGFMGRKERLKKQARKLTSPAVHQIS